MESPNIGWNVNFKQFEVAAPDHVLGGTKGQTGVGRRVQPCMDERSAAESAEIEEENEQKEKEFGEAIR